MARGGFRLDNGGRTLTVTVTTSSGGTPTCYTTSTGASTQSLPATISADTSFFFDGPEELTISVKTGGGAEIASSNGGTIPFSVRNGQFSELAPSVDRTEFGAVDGGAFRAVADSAVVINVAAQAGATADAQFQAALTAAVVAVASGGGATVVLPPGVSNWTGSVPTLPDLSNYTGKIRVTGSALGSTVKLSATAKRFLDFARTADYQAFGSIEIDRITFDCNGIDAHDHVIVGTIVNNATQARVNMRDIYVHDVEVINAPTNANPNSLRAAIKLYSWHPASNEATQTYIKDVRVERLRMRRNGSGGVAVGATGGGGGNAVNCLIDNITFKDSEASSFAALLTAPLDIATVISGTTITGLDDTSGFPTTGQVNIFSGGSTWNFTYTGKTSTTLTGVTRTAGPTTGTIPTTCPVGMPVTSSFIIGNYGIGGTYTVENLIGGYSGDDIFEFNAFTVLNARNLVGEVCTNEALYLYNYNSPLRPAEQVANVDGLVHREPYTKSGSVAVFLQTVATLGTINLRGIRQFLTADNSVGSNIYGRLLVVAGAVSRVTLKDAQIEWGMTGTAGSLFFTPCVHLASTVACHAVLEDVRGSVTGALTLGGNDPTVELVQVVGTNTRFFIDRAQFACTVTGLNATRCTMIDVGTVGSSNNAYGEIRSPRVLDYTGQTSGRGVRIASTTNTLSSTKRIKIVDPDFSQAGSGVTDVSFQGATTNAQYVDVIRPLLHTGIRPAAVVVTVGASPFVYQNGVTQSSAALGYSGGVSVQGGTVTKIEVSADGSTYIDTGITAGVVPLPNGQYVKVTYSVAPTMTFIPTP